MILHILEPLSRSAQSPLRNAQPLVPWCPGALVPWCPGALGARERAVPIIRTPEIIHPSVPRLAMSEHVESTSTGICATCFYCFYYSCSTHPRSTVDSTVGRTLPWKVSRQQHPKQAHMLLNPSILQSLYIPNLGSHTPPVKPPTSLATSHHRRPPNSTPPPQCLSELFFSWFHFPAPPEISPGKNTDAAGSLLHRVLNSQARKEAYRSSTTSESFTWTATPCLSGMRSSKMRHKSTAG